MMENVLFKLFSEYCMEGRTYSKSLLSARRFADLCKDSDLPPLKTLRSLSFSSFCETIHKLAEAQFPEEFNSDPEQAIDTLVEEYLLPLSRHISAKRNIVQLRDLNVPNSVLKITHSLHKSFHEIYTQEFPWELKSSGSLEFIYQSSFKHMAYLLSSFEIYPCILNKVKMHGIWRDIVIMPEEKFQLLISEALIPETQTDKGRAFTLSKFILIFYCCAMYGYSTETDITLKFLNILHRMQIALKKQLKYKSISLIPCEAENSNEKEIQQEKISEDTETTECIDTEPFLVHSNGSEILKLHKFLKALRNAGVVPRVGEQTKASQITQEEAELIYTQAKAMNYSKFSKTLETIPEVNEEAREKIENEVFSKPTEIDSFRHLSDRNIMKITPMVSKVMQDMFFYYTKSKEIMNIQQFIQFSREFEIFPDLVSNFKLKMLFRQAEGYSEYTQDHFIENEGIDFERFIKVILVLAFETHKQGSLVGKVIHLFKRMGTSSGPVAVYKSLGYIQSYQQQVYKLVNQIEQLLLP